MNKQQSQAGIAHQLIIIILVIALLGALSFVYWQNFIQTKSVADNTQKTTIDTNQKTLTVSEWGVEGGYSSPNTLSYTFEQAGRVNSDGISTATTLFFTVKGREQCGSIEPITRTKGDTPLTDLGLYVGDYLNGATVADELSDSSTSLKNGDISIEYKHIGSYYYIYQAPTFGNWPSADYPATCKDATKEAEDVKSIHDFFQSLKSL